LHPQQSSDRSGGKRAGSQRVWFWRFAVLGLIFVAAMIWRWMEQHATGMILQVVCSYSGGISKKDPPWDLVLDGSGDGLLTTEGTAPGRRISVPETVAELQKIITECDLAQLPSADDPEPLGKAMCRIMIRTMNFQKTMTIKDLRKAAGDGCAAQVWRVMQRCYDEQMRPNVGQAASLPNR
jgi:hypothetical protein